MDIKSPGSCSRQSSLSSRHSSPAPRSPTISHPHSVSSSTTSYYTPPSKSPQSIRSPSYSTSAQIFNFPEINNQKISKPTCNIPKSPTAAPKSPVSGPKSPIMGPKSPMVSAKILPKSPKHSPKSPSFSFSGTKSTKSFKLATASNSYPEVHSPTENYFNFNLPSPKKTYSHTKVVYKGVSRNVSNQQQYSVKTSSVEYKISNMDDNFEKPPLEKNSAKFSAKTSSIPKCNIRTNPCYEVSSMYASSNSINESEHSIEPRSVNRCRKSTSDLTDMTDDNVSTTMTSLSRPSSPRRRGSMKGGLAYLASRRGSRDSVASNVSNEDIGPLNFQNTARGRQRRTSNFLELPVPDHIRPRVCSLPEKAYNPRLSDDLYRLRTFSITNKGGVVNCGDSIINRRSRSNTSVNSTASRASNVSGERSPFDGSCCGSGYHTVDSTPLGSPEEREIPKYRVVLLGDSGVGKTALVSQFMTSEYMNTYDASLDDEFGEKTVSVLLDGEESEMIFIDHPAVEMSVENSLSTYEPHACVVVYSITAKESFQAAEEILNYLWRERYTQEKSVIVVGNKADLARSRVISSNDGKALAVSRDCKFIETSSGIQHNVDELLVGILKQIRLRQSRDRKQQHKSAAKRDNHKLHGSKTSLSLNIAREILQKICMNDISKSKSCENLHVL